MSRRRLAIALSALSLVAGASLPCTPAAAGGDIIEERPVRVHRHRAPVRRITLIRETAAPVYTGTTTVAAPVESGPRVRRGNFHGRFIGGNYAYNTAYQDVMTYTNNRYLESHRVTPFVAQDLVDPDNVNSVYNSGVPYSRSESVPEHGGGGIYDRSTSLMPATRGQFYENRTRDAYLYGYDYETENPACWSRQQIGSQVRSVWTCAGR